MSRQHLETEISSLKNSLLELTSIIEDVVRKSVRSLQEKDKPLAKQVMKMDQEIDDREVKIEEDCLKILALHQPVAIDLRYIIGVMKMNNDLERIGDLAVNISERAHFIIKQPAVTAPFDLSEMAQKTITMLKEAIDSLINMDEELAKEVIRKDQEVDDLNYEMYTLIFKAIKSDPENVAAYMNYISASRHLERIADYTTNICEDVIYMISGTIVRHSPEVYE